MHRTLALLMAALAGCSITDILESGAEVVDLPMLDGDRVTLELGEDAIRVTGRAGTVVPGGAVVEIINLVTGAGAEASAAADGSFDLTLEGSPSDLFAVRAVVAGERSAIVYVVDGDLAATGNHAGALSCERLEELAATVLGASEAGADESCSGDADCVPTRRRARCADSCDPVYVSHAGAVQIADSNQALDDWLCTSFDDFCVSGTPRLCRDPVPGSCVAGRCAASGTLSCDERKQRASAEITEAIAAADTTCTRRTDCVTASSATLCNDACVPAAVSRTGQAQIEGAVRVANHALCESYRSDGCDFAVVSCGPESSFTPRCVAGHCTLERPANIHDCTECLDDTLVWRTIDANGAAPDTSELKPCARYTHRRTRSTDPRAVGTACSLDLVECNTPASAGAVLGALAHEDVQHAFDDFLSFGRVRDTSVLEIEMGTSTIRVGKACEVPPPNCRPPTPGVQALVDLLQTIDEQMLATEECGQFAQ